MNTFIRLGIERRRKRDLFQENLKRKFPEKIANLPKNVIFDTKSKKNLLNIRWNNDWIKSTTDIYKAESKIVLIGLVRIHAPTILEFHWLFYCPQKWAVFDQK